MNEPRRSSQSRPSTFFVSLLFAGLFVAGGQLGGCSSGGSGTEGSGGTTGSGGVTSSGGTTGSGGKASSGGATGSGGTTSTGGSTGTGGHATGGSTGSGGAASGGATATGGSTASGGATASGGSTAPGGSTGHGGAAGTGNGGRANGGTMGGGGRTGSGGMTGQGGSVGDKGGAGVLPLTMTLTSSAFTEGAAYPASITCADSSMGSPDLTWTAGPTGTMSYAVTLTDLTNGYVHWAIWNIPSATMMLPAKLATTATLTAPAGAQQLNAFSGNGYYGPCPMGSVHTYQFRVYALSVAMLPGPTPTMSSTAMTASTKATIVQNAIGSGTLTGTSNANRM